MTVTDDDQLGHQLGVEPGSGPVTARDTVNAMVDASLLDEVKTRTDAGELVLTGDGGFLPEMIKAVLERGLAAEQTAHLAMRRATRAGAAPRTRATGRRRRP